MNPAQNAALNPVPPTPRRTRRLAALSVALLALVLTACGEGEEAAVEPAAAPAAESLLVEDAWVRATTGTEEPGMTAAFMVLDNEGDAEVTVTGAGSPSAGAVELHEMAVVDGESVMRELEGGIVLAPGRGQLLQPGGMHVMLMDLSGELAAGDEVDLTLELSDGSQVELVAPVKEFTEEEGHYHAPGAGAHDHDHDH